MCTEDCNKLCQFFYVLQITKEVKKSAKNKAQILQRRAFQQNEACNIRGDS